MDGRIQSHLGRIAEVLELLRNNTLGNRSGAVLGSLGAVPVARRAALGTARSLRRAAIRQMALLEDPALKRLVRLWLGILNANVDLRTDVADAVDVVDGPVDVMGEKNRQEALVVAVESLSLLQQEAANQAAGVGSAAEDGQEAIADMQQTIAGMVSEDSSISEVLVRELTDEERSTLGI